MKKTFILCCMAVITAAPICLAQATSPQPAKKAAASETTISDMEKSAWEAYKNKQTDKFKALMSKDYCGVYAEGVKNLDSELADMAKSDLREYSFANRRVFSQHRRVVVPTKRARVRAIGDEKNF